MNIIIHLGPAHDLCLLHHSCDQLMRYHFSVAYQILHGFARNQTAQYASISNSKGPTGFPLNEGMPDALILWTWCMTVDTTCLGLVLTPATWRGAWAGSLGPEWLASVLCPGPEALFVCWNKSSGHLERREQATRSSTMASNQSCNFSPPGGNWHQHLHLQAVSEFCRIRKWPKGGEGWNCSAAPSNRVCHIIYACNMTRSSEQNVAIIREPSVVGNQAHVDRLGN